MPLINPIDRNQNGYGTAIDDYKSWHDTLVRKEKIPIIGGFFCGAGLLLHDLKTVFFNNIWVAPVDRDDFAEKTYRRANSCSDRVYSLANVLTVGIAGVVASLIVVCLKPCTVGTLNF